VGIGCRTGVVKLEAFDLSPLESLLIRAAKAFGSWFDGQQLCAFRRAVFACIVDLSSIRAYASSDSPATSKAYLSRVVLQRLHWFFITEELPFLECCTLSPQTQTNASAVFQKPLFSRPPSSLVVYLQIVMHLAGMHLHHAKRQDLITAPPTASGITGSTTAGDPSATELVVGTGTGPGPSNGPGLAPGFVSTCLALVSPYSQLPIIVETVSL